MGMQYRRRSRPGTASRATPEAAPDITSGTQSTTESDTDPETRSDAASDTGSDAAFGTNPGTRTPTRTRPRPRAAGAAAGLALAAAAATVAALLTPIGGLAGGDGEKESGLGVARPGAAAGPEAGTSGVPAPPPGAAAPSPSAKDGRRPAFGAYLDYGERGVRSIAAYSRWLGGAEVRVGHTYLPGDRWENIAGGHGFLDPWASWRRAKADRMLVLNVPMLERNEEGLDDDEVRALLRRGAAGEFDQHFYRLAERLVRLGIPDTVLVPGWEMNGTTYTHRCGPDPAAWKKYWTRLVTVMRLVPGQKFRFDFTPSRGRDAIAWTECYPGDDVVDIIGMDAYDQPSDLSFEEQVAEPYGLRDHAAFAAAHRKPISFPEWGLFRGGGNGGDTDNVAYMQGMLDWIDEHKPLYQTITDYCPHGVWQCHQNPRSAALYRAYVSGGEAPAEPGWPQEPGTPEEPGMPEEPQIPEPEIPTDPGGTGDTCGPDWLPDWIGGAAC